MSATNYAEEKLIKDVAKLLRDAVTKREIDDIELARRLGKSKSWISMVLNGKQNLQLRTLAQILSALEFSIEEIILDDWEVDE